MAAPKIAAVATATPPWRYDQATVLRMSGYGDPRRMGFFSNSLIETRHLYMDPETFTPDESVDQLNDRWRRGAVEVGKAAVARAIEQAGWRRGRRLPRHHHLHGRVCESRRADHQRARTQAHHPARARGRYRLRQRDGSDAAGLQPPARVPGASRGDGGGGDLLGGLLPRRPARERGGARHLRHGAGAIALSTEAAGPEIVEHRTMFRSEHLGAMGF
jgi:hypothetical protein